MEAVLITTYLINKSPYRVLSGVSPVEHMTSFFSSTLNMRSLQFHVFGCVVFDHVHRQHRGKFDPRVVKCVFLGNSPTKRDMNATIPQVGASLLP